MGRSLGGGRVVRAGLSRFKDNDDEGLVECKLDLTGLIARLIIWGKIIYKRNSARL